MSSIGVRGACRCGVCRFYVVFGQSPVALGPRGGRPLLIAASWLSAREEDVDCGGVSGICDRCAGLCRKARWGNLLRLSRCHRPKEWEGRRLGYNLWPRRCRRVLEAGRFVGEGTGPLVDSGFCCIGLPIADILAGCNVFCGTNPLDLTIVAAPDTTRRAGYGQCLAVRPVTTLALRGPAC